LLEADLPKESFDICILSNVLERSQNPLELLGQINQLLKPGGCILVATPTLESLSARIMRAKWPEFNLEHLFYFRSSNLQMALYKAGFGRLSMFAHKKTVNLNYVETHFGKYSGNSHVRKGVKTLCSSLPSILRRKEFKTDGSGMVALGEKLSDQPLLIKSLSVIVPVYNEKGTFPFLINNLRFMRPANLELEVIIVESGSTDGTREEVLKLKGEPGIKIVLQDRPRGKGFAVREALLHVSGDVVLIQDADLEYDLNDYEALLRPICRLKSSFVLGARHKGRSMKMRRFLDRPALARLINFGHFMLTGLFNLLYGQNIRDPFTMFKVIRSDAIAGIGFQCDHFDFDIEFVIKVLQRGFKPVEIPVNYASRSFSEGKKVSFRRDPLRILAAMLKLRFAKRF
jgi:hypothetical protein